jgi:hypothetical protein
MQMESTTLLAAYFPLFTCLAYSLTPEIEAVHSSKTLNFYQIIHQHIPKTASVLVLDLVLVLLFQIQADTG